MVAIALAILMTADAVGSVSQWNPKDGKQSYYKMHGLFSLYFACCVRNSECVTLL